MNIGLSHFRQSVASKYHECEVTAFEDPRDESVWRVKIGDDKVSAAMDEMMARRIAAALQYFKGIPTEEVGQIVADGETYAPPHIS